LPRSAWPRPWPACEGSLHGAHPDPRARRARAQPEKHRRGDPPGPPCRDHRGLGVGEVVAGLRHDLRGGAAPLRRVPLRLRTPVPRADGEARCRRDRRALPRHLHRAEVGREEPPVHGRHRHRDLRLPAAPVRLRGGRPLSLLRPGDPPADRLPDRRYRDGNGRGGEGQGPCPDRARPQGGVPEGARPARPGRLLPRHRGRRGETPGRGDRPRQEEKARHRGGGGPGARFRGLPGEAVRLRGALPYPLRRAGAHRRREGRRRHLQREVRLPRLPRELPRGDPATVFLQQPPRRMPGVRWPGDDHLLRPRPDRPRQDEKHPGGAESPPGASGRRFSTTR